MLFVNTLISQFLVLFLWRVVMSMRKISIPILWSFHPQLSSSIFRTYCGTRNRRYQHPTKFSNIFSPSHYCVTGKFWWRNCSQLLNSYRMTIFFQAYYIYLFKILKYILFDVIKKGLCIFELFQNLIRGY